jgi:hypothetical protein
MVRMAPIMLKDLVIVPNEKTVEFGSLLAFARAEACRREHTETNPTIRALAFVAEVGVYVAVYEVSELSLKNQQKK